MKHVTIYSTGLCSYCRSAKELLATYSVEPEEIRVDQDPTKMREMMEKTGKMSVPQIYIEDTLIGGYSELKQMHDAGTLKETLA